MFSENERISARQLYRAIVVTLAGPTLLICPRIAERFGADGTFVYLIAGGLSAAYVALAIKLRKCKFFGEEASGGTICLIINGFIRAITCIKLLLLAIGGLYLIVDVISGILLPETHIFVILLPIAVALVYWNLGSIENTARAFELLFYSVIIPIFIVIVVAVPKVYYENIIPDGTAGFKEMFLAALLMWVLFTPAELLVLCGKHYKKDKKTDMAIWRGVLVVFAGNLVTYLVILGIYGEAGMNRGGTYPLLKVMQISGIPGDFLRRVDGFMSVFLILSLFCGLVMLKNYLTINVWTIGELVSGHKDGKKNEEMKKLIFSVSVIVIMVASTMVMKNKISMSESDSLPIETYAEKKVISLVELEDRGFVLSVILGNDTVTFEFAADESGEWQRKSEYVTLKTDKLWEAEVLYKENGDKRLDFTHMKMIFIDGNIYKNDTTIKNLRYMYEKEKFAENTLVCILEGDLKKETANAMENGEAFAVRMEKIMEGSGKGRNMELYMVYNHILSEE